jgi:hypothetical protein
MSIQIKTVLRGLPGRCLGAVALAATLAELAGPVFAAGLGAPLLRLALGEGPSPEAGALEAGAIAAATWWVFEA